MNAVGNILRALVVSCFVFSVYGAVRLSVTDANGEHLEQIGAGQPCRVMVEYEAKGESSLLSIEGIEQFPRTGRISQTSITPAGRVERQGFVIRIDEIGSYTIGPAHVQIDGKKEVSEPLHLEVRQEAKTITSSRIKGRTQPFARLTVLPEEVFVREPIDCALRFYFLRNEVRNVSGHLAEVDGTVVIDHENAKQGSERIDGKVWNYVEWSWRLYSTHAGNLTIPACSIQYEDVHSGGFFFTTLHPKEIYSNAVTLRVKELPVCDQPLQAVGSFNRMDLRIDPSIVRAGDAVVVSLRVEGEGLFDDTYPLTLQGVPEALKWYESKKEPLTLERDGCTGKVFEFVVQGLKEGEWSIPEQQFVYFDTKAQECRILTSLPMALTITPGQAVVGMVPTLLETPSAVSDSQELAPAIVGTGLSWWAQEKGEVPWWLMVLLMVVPTSVVMIALIRRHLLQTPLVRKKTIFLKAREELRNITRKGDIQNIYALFTTLFARLYDDPSVDLMSEELQLRLRNAGLKTETLERWQQFVDRCAECAFYSPESEVSKESLLLIAEQWLIFFKERL